MDQEIRELREEVASLRDRLLVLEAILINRPPGPPRPLEPPVVEWSDDERDICFRYGEYINIGVKHDCYD